MQAALEIPDPPQITLNSVSTETPDEPMISEQNSEQ